MSYRELERQEAKEFARDCRRVLVFVLVVVALAFVSHLAGCDGAAQDYDVPSVEEIRNEDAPALVGLGRGVYAYPAWDRASNVCYLVVTHGDEMVVIPRLNPDGTVMVLKGE